jgi:phage terminase Nu1 subunit (DNA packaging protein)
LKVVNKREMASILGVSERTLTEWQKEGMPFVKGEERGNSIYYQTPEVIEWMIAREKARAPGQEGERDRLARLQGDVLEMTLAEKRRTLILASEIEPAWNAMVVSARQSLLTLPLRLAPILVGMTDVDQVRDLLDEQVHDALAKLAGGDAGAGGDDTAGPSELGASGADPAFAVG